MNRKPDKLELELTPELTAGQMVLAGFEGTGLPAAVEKALREGHIAGVILFSRNLENPEQIRELTDSIRKAANIPPIIAIDQEGGRVTRLPEPFTKWPAMRAVGKKADTSGVRELAHAMAAEMLAVGINTDFAPVLDVDSNPDNPIIGDRSFSQEAHRAAHLGAAMIEGFTLAGMISCGKHFPGHGDTSVDSHLDLPVVDADATMLERRELVPFQEAMQSHVPTIMTAHVKVPALDPYYPATISIRILTELLREQMGYEGVIITDDLEMGALAKHMPLADAVYSSVKAGADMVMACSGIESAMECHATILEGIGQGIIDFGVTVRSMRRVLALKEDFLLTGPPSWDEAKNIIGCDEHKKIMEKYAE